MHPILFKIPPFEIFGLKLGDWQVHSFGVMMVIAFFAALWLARSLAQRRGLDPNKLADLFFWVLIAGVIGARLLFILQEHEYYRVHPKELYSIQFAGLTSFGGIIAGLAAVLVWCKRTKISAVRVLDVAGPALLMGHAIGRIGCLLNGCCAGGSCPTWVPWKVYAEGGTYVHPAQAYDSLMTFAALGIVLWLIRRHDFLGKAMALSIGFYGVSRFIYEFWRAGVSSTYMGRLPITDAQAAALVMVVIGIALYVVYRRRGVKANLEDAAHPGPSPAIRTEEVPVA